MGEDLDFNGGLTLSDKNGNVIYKGIIPISVDVATKKDTTTYSLLKFNKNREFTIKGQFLNQGGMLRLLNQLCCNDKGQIKIIRKHMRLEKYNKRVINRQKLYNKLKKLGRKL